jgi:GntR family transcriptional regulator, transcriptional repressor for pyruvate dehydrogenase complex
MAVRKSDDHRLYISIAREIRDQIEQGVYRPGDRLPPLAELAEAYGCSRSTVREALAALRGQGLVEFRHGNGTYVRTATVEMWMEPLEAAILLGTNQLVELVELQVTLLAGIASFTAGRVSHLDTGPLLDALFRLECAKPGSEESVAAELSFYSALALVSGNSLFENSLRVMQEGLRSVLRMANREDISRGVRVCRALYDSVLGGNTLHAVETVYQYGREIIHAISRTRPASHSS